MYHSSFDITGEPAHTATFDATGAGQPSSTVIGALATVTDTDPLELEPLYHSIDVEALDRLFAHTTKKTGDDCLTVSFEVDGWHLVLADGEVLVYETE